jgi:hypothetical protein
MKFIIAGNYHEFEDYIAHHSGTYTFLTDTSQLKGVVKPKFIYTGKFYENALIKEHRLTEFGID